MRNDKEGVFSNSDQHSLLESVRSKGYITELWDTDVNETFREHEKLAIVMRHLDYIGSFDAVVTDRYHGLIFSVLTKNTVRRSALTHNHKLTSAFDWFEKVNFVIRIDSPNNTTAALNELERIEERAHRTGIAIILTRWLRKSRTLLT